ncbi:MAG: T9SS type A sorting domain-containing protein, partial [Flavobacteriia bacterium]|nr:T9SS type A sorting domain-containing protein [Flavobacteriia bacterium]
TLRNTPPCPDPTNFQSWDVTSSSAMVAFSAAAGSNRIVEWGPAGFTPGTGQTANSTTDTVSLTGLPAGTCLDVYIQADCSGSGNGVSSVQGPYTICTAYVPDWLQDFNGGYPPGDFSEAVGQFGAALAYGSSNWNQDTYANASGGSVCARFNIYSTFQPHHWMVSPAIDVGTGNTYNLEYDIAWTEYAQTASAVIGSDDTVHVAISTDGGATFQRSNIVASYHTGNPIDASGTHEVYQLTGYTGIIYIGFYTTSTVSNEDTDFFVDNLEVRTPPACQEPFGFSAISTFPDSIHYTFNADSSAVGYVIEWGPCGYTPGTGMTDTIYNDTAGLGGLSAASCYDMYIMTLCGSSTSIWGGPFTFTTACDTLPIPWSEDFESVSVPDYPTCWDFSTSNVFYLQTVSGSSGMNPGSRSGSNYLLHRYSFNNDWWSFTPEFNLQAGTSYEISFWYQTEGTTAFDEVTLAFGPGQTPADMIYNITTQTGVSSTTYTQFVATFIPPTTGVYHIGLKTRTNGFTGAMNIDDFNLQYDPNPCPNVSSLIANIVDENEVNLAWGGTSAHTSYDVEWGPSGFQVGTGQGRLVTGLSTAGLNIDTLSENTCYDFYVRADCGSGPGAWVGPYRWCTPCSASPLPYSQDFTGTGWTCVDPALGAQPWVSYNGWAEASYWSYNDIDFIMQMRNVDVTVDARVKFKWSHEYQTFYPEDRLTLLARVLGTTTWDTIWHKGGPDLNSNDGATATVPGTGVNEIVALPSGTYTGNVVEFRFLGHSDFGPDVFVDDFLVEALPSCPEPYSIDAIATASTTTTGTVYFAPGGASNFNLAYGPAATTATPAQGTIVNATNDTVVLTGLQPATLYNVWVRDSCGVGDVSLWTGPAQFQTLCVPYTTPYLETFTAWEPTCWDVAAGTSPWVQDAGWAEAQFWSFNNADFIMNSPQIVLSDTSELSFKWSKQYNANYPDDGYVRVRNVNSMAWDTLWSRLGSAFESNDGAGPTTKGSGVSEYIRINGYGAGDTIIIQFYGESSWGPNWYIDDFYVYDAPACAGPSNLGSTNETSTSADLYWTPGSGSSTGWVIEYGPAGLTPGNGTIVATTNDTTTLTGLMPASGYCYFVTEICPNGVDSSSAIGPFCFATLCPPSFTAPYFTDLEVLPAGNVSSGTWENCWTISNGPGVPRWESEDASGANENSLNTGPWVDHTLNGSPGGIYMYLETSGGTLGDTASARLPWVDASTLNVPELAFWYHMYGATMGNLWIEGRDANNSTWVVLDSIMGQQQTAGSDAWLEKTVLLNNFTSDTIQIRFVGERGSNFNSDMSIDDIEIREAPTCPKINSVSFSNQTTSSADANWTATVTGQTYQIEYGGPGFTQGTGTMVPVTGTSYSFTGLPQNLVSEMYIRPICGAGDTGQWTGPFVIQILPVPCDDFEAYNLGLVDAQSVFIEGWNGAGGDAEVVSYSGTQAMRIYDAGPSGFSDVVALMDTMTSGTHIVGFDFQLATGAGGYYNILHNYTGPSNVWAIEVYMDANGTATVNQGTNGTGVIGTYSFNTTGWNRIEHVIDLDNDTAYIIVNGNVTTVGWQFSLGSFNQADRFNAVNFYSAANAGQTPDYYVDNFCVCSVPGGIQATNTTCTSTDLDWMSQSGMGIVEYGAAGFTQGSGTIMMATAPYTITGLTAGQSYDFYVGEECNGDTLYNGPITVMMPNGPLPSLQITHFQDFVDLDSANYRFAVVNVGADSVYWDFGGGVTASGDTAYNTYLSNGQYSVQVTAFNDCGDTTYTYNFDVENISLTESTLGRTLSIYPNPSTGVVTLDFTLDRNEETDVYILNGLGQRVMKADLGTINSFNGQIDMSHLPRGVYILQVNTGSHMVNRRVTLH